MAESQVRCQPVRSPCFAQALAAWALAAARAMQVWVVTSGLHPSQPELPWRIGWVWGGIWEWGREWKTSCGLYGRLWQVTPKCCWQLV